MAKKKRLPRCPYCGRRLDYWEAWMVRTEGEYDCPRCSNASNIVYHPHLYRLAALTVLIGVLLFMGVTLLFKGENLWGMLLVSLPFVLFVLCACRYMRLEGFGVRKTPQIAPGYAGRKEPASRRPSAPPAARPQYRSAPAPRRPSPPPPVRPRSASPAPRPRKAGDDGDVKLFVPPPRRSERDQTLRPLSPQTGGFQEPLPGRRPAAPVQPIRPPRAGAPRTPRAREEKELKHILDEFTGPGPKMP